MYIRISKKSRLAFSLAEVLVASALFGIVGLALGEVYLMSTRTFAAMANYATLDQNNRLGMDKMTKEIRESKAIMYAVTNAAGTSASINLINYGGDSVTYSFDGTAGALTRTVVPAGSTTALKPQIIIPNCQVLSFDIGQRTPTNGTFDTWGLLSTNDHIQVINLTWRAWRRIPGMSIGTSEEIQTAHVVVRNQYAFQHGLMTVTE
jgi:hypothetical protein